MLKFLAFLNEIRIVIQETITSWINDNIPVHGAALAFYTIFSIAPLIIIIIAVTGFLFGEQASEGQLDQYLGTIFGDEMAGTLQNFVASAHEPTAGLVATLISVGVILFSATTIIAQLKHTLNTIWGVKIVSGAGLKRFLITRALSLLTIFMFAGLLMASIVLNIALGHLEPVLDPIMPGGVAVWAQLNNLLFFLITVVLFAVILKFLPDIIISWKDVWVGAVVTALLFFLGRYLISLYLLQDDVSNTYSAAGSFVIFLIWVYYNTLVIFLGAEFTKVYNLRFGKRVEPAKNVELEL